MELNGDHVFDHPQAMVWEALMDPSAIAHAIPGTEELVPLEGEPQAWRADAKISIASVSGRYSGVIRMTEIEAPNQYRLNVSGEGQQSIINGSALIKLVYDPSAKQTLLHWDAEVNINGKLVRVGQRLINSTAGLMSKNFFDAIDRQISAHPPQVSEPPRMYLGSRLQAWFRWLLHIFRGTHVKPDHREE